MQGLIDEKLMSAYVSDVADMIRNAILAEFNRRGLNPYQLWKLVEGAGVSRATVYAFTNGKTTLSTEHAGKMMDALGLTIHAPAHDVRPPAAKKPARKIKSRRTEN